MGVLYHINPYTGVPGVCHAVRGKCPYGGNTGLQNHYLTYEEAQKAADQMQADNFQKYSMCENEDRNRDWSEVNRYDYLNHMSDDEALSEVINTTDPGLLSDVINGKVLAKADNDPKFVHAALQNDNLSENTMSLILENPKEYTKEALYSFENNNMLTSAGRISLINADPTDAQFVDRILTHPGISSESIRETLDNFSESNSEHYPPSVARIIFNDNCPKDLFDKWTTIPEYKAFVDMKR